MSDTIDLDTKKNRIFKLLKEATPDNPKPLCTLLCFSKRSLHNWLVQRSRLSPTLAIKSQTVSGGSAKIITIDRQGMRAPRTKAQVVTRPT